MQVWFSASLRRESEPDREDTCTPLRQDLVLARRTKQLIKRHCGHSRQVDPPTSDPEGFEEAAGLSHLIDSGRDGISGWAERTSE